MSRILIIIGSMLIAAGIFWPWIKKMNLGHLPGDIFFKKDGFVFSFPIVTCIILSVLFSFLLWFFNKH